MTMMTVNEGRLLGIAEGLCEHRGSDEPFFRRYAVLPLVTCPLLKYLWATSYRSSVLTSYFLSTTPLWKLTLRYLARHRSRHIMLSQAPVPSAGVIMASDSGESPASSDILTPDDSVSFIESDQESNMSEAADKSAADKSAADKSEADKVAGHAYQYGFAVGHELMTARTEELSNFDNECDGPIRPHSRKEVIPDCSGRYVELKLDLRNLKLVS